MVYLLYQFSSGKSSGRKEIDIIKLPNKYGSVYKLPGNRRKPWAVRKTKSWFIDENDKLKRTYEYIRYYESRQEALQALAEYNKNPYAIQSEISFKEVYDKWSEHKFDEN